MLWLLTQTVNEMPEFRTALTEKGLGYFSEMHPAYTIFNQEQKTFSGIWTAHKSNYTALMLRNIPHLKNMIRNRKDPSIHLTYP